MMFRLVFAAFFGFVWSQASRDEGTATPEASVRLRNGFELPLVGLGVGNMAHEEIEGAVRYGVSQGLQLIDTAAASRNSHIIARALAGQPAPAVVLTKVWYTMLGYERTKLSVQQSLRELGRNKLDIVLLHWPRCNDDIPWMRCEEEEQELPSHVKAIGPPPNHDSWRESWRALEELYQTGVIGAIGVSNFDLQDMRALVSMATEPPHLLQGNVWSVVFDPHLMSFLSLHHIHFQAYNVMNILQGKPVPHYQKHSSHAQQAVEKVGVGARVPPSTVILRWLVQQQVSVIPRTANKRHLASNAQAAAIALTELEMATIDHAVETLLRAGADLPMTPELSRWLRDGGLDIDTQTDHGEL